MKTRLFRLISPLVLALQLQAAINFNIVCIGDSLTEGFAASNPATKAYPIRMDSGAYLRDAATTQSTPLNKGVGGRKIIGGIGEACINVTSGQCLSTTNNDPVSCSMTMTGAATQSACVDGLLIAGRTNVLVLWGGTNDIAACCASYGGAVAGPIRIADAFTSYVAARIAAGWTVVGVTTIARNWGDATRETIRQDYNTRIRATSGITLADVAADVAFDAGFGAGSPAYDNATWYNADKIHLTDAGYDLIAQLVATAINTLPRGYLFPLPGSVGR